VNFYLGNFYKVAFLGSSKEGAWTKWPSGKYAYVQDHAHGSSLYTQLLSPR